MIYVTEADLQIQVCSYLDLVLPKNSIYHHSANEGAGNKVQFYRKLKRMGFKAGWPDLEIVTPGKPAIFLELKREGNYPTVHQKEIHTRLKEAGAEVFVCKSLRDVHEALKDILALIKHPNITTMLLYEETMRADIERMRLNNRKRKRLKARKKKELST
jgi:hypothetical protein